MPRLNFTAVDFETANPNRASICGVGLVAVRNGRTVAADHFGVDPRVPFHWANTRTHGIRPSDVRGGPRFRSAFPRIKKLFAGADFLVAHNVGFDRSVMLAAYEHAKVRAPALQWVCTLKLSHQHISTSQRFKMSQSPDSRTILVLGSTGTVGAQLGLFVHLHALVTDGCFDALDQSEPRFLPIAELSDEHLRRTLQRVHADIAALEPDHEDEGDHDAAMAACVQLALPLRAAAPSSRAPAAASPLLVTALGMQLHAAVTVDGRDRSRLERLCRYLLRPPFAQDAVQRTPDGQVRVHFKKPNRCGATYAQMTPDTFLARLCALIPPPGAHTVRYYGVLAGHHALRSRVIPRPQEAPPPKQLALFLPHGPLELPAITSLLDTQLRSAAPHRLSWMTLLARVFRIDISVCPRCAGPIRVTRAVTTPEQIAAELRGARPPPRSEPPGQLLLFSLSLA